jgi:hypothetical protein
VDQVYILKPDLPKDIEADAYAGKLQVEQVPDVAVTLIGQLPFA